MMTGVKVAIANQNLKSEPFYAYYFVKKLADVRHNQIWHVH